MLKPRKRRPKGKEGDLIKIPYKPGWHIYARIITEGSYAYYDYPSDKEDTDFAAIISADVLFVAHTDVFGLKEGYWTIVANIPFEEGDQLKGYYPRYFNPNPAAPETLGFYNVYKAEIEGAIAKDWIKTGRIQMDGIWGRPHIEDRVNAYYNGKRCFENDIWIKIFKDGFGLPQL